MDTKLFFNQKLLDVIAILVISSAFIGFCTPSAFAQGRGIVGERLDDERVTFYVNHVSEATKIGNWEPKPGYKFLLLDITVKNRLAVPTSFRSLLDVETSDGFNYTYSGGTHDFVNGSFHFAEIELLGRDVARAIFPIQIPKDVSPRTLYVAEAGEYYARFVVDLSLKKEPPDISPNSEVALRSNKGYTTTVDYFSFDIFGSKTRINFGSEKIVTSAGQYWPSEEGWTYYIVKTDITNIGNDTAYYTSEFFLVKDSNGFLYKSVGAIGNGKETLLNSKFLNPGEGVSAEIIFKVPESQDRFMIMYGPIGNVVSLTDRPAENETTTLSITLTSITTATSTGQVVEPSIYAWAIGATVIAAVFALVLLKKR